LPLHVLTHPYLNRSCQSDQLARFANRTFGALPGAYQRVTAMSNRIHDNLD
jgi:hypothetical protein